MGWNLIIGVLSVAETTSGVTFKETSTSTVPFPVVPKKVVSNLEGEESVKVFEVLQFCKTFPWPSLNLYLLSEGKLKGVAVNVILLGEG